MTTSGQPRPAFPDEAEMARKWAAVAERSQRVVQAFTERQERAGIFRLWICKASAALSWT